MTETTKTVESWCKWCGETKKVKVPAKAISTICPKCKMHLSLPKEFPKKKLPRGKGGARY